MKIATAIVSFAVGAGLVTGCHLASRFMCARRTSGEGYALTGWEWRRDWCCVDATTHDDGMISPAERLRPALRGGVSRGTCKEIWP